MNQEANEVTWAVLNTLADNQDERPMSKIRDYVMDWIKPEWRDEKAEEMFENEVELPIVDPDINWAFIAAWFVREWTHEYKTRYTEPANGYTNWPTYLTALYWDNTYRMYTLRQEKIEMWRRDPNRVALLADWIHRNTSFLEAGLRFGDLKVINWTELAQAEFDEYDLQNKAQDSEGKE